MPQYGPRCAENVKSGKVKELAEKEKEREVGREESAVSCFIRKL